MIEASNKNRTAFEFNKSLHKDTQSIFDSFFKETNVKHFRYMKMYKDYTYLSLGTNLDYLQVYLQQIKEPGKIFEPIKIYASPALVSGKGEFCYFLWPSEYSPLIKDPLYNILYQFNVWNGFTISRNEKDFIETWSFATSKEYSLISQFYINNISLLDFFIHFFCNKIKPYIDNIKKEHLAVFENKFNLSITEDFQQKRTNVFLDDRVLKGYIILRKGVPCKLSLRELECLIFMARGYTSSYVAGIFNVSPRTIESCLNSIKQKTEIIHKSQLSDLIPTRDLCFLTDIVNRKYPHY